MSKAFTAVFKLETAKLILNQNYTQEEAAKGMNVSRSAIDRWEEEASASNGKVRPRQACH